MIDVIRVGPTRARPTLSRCAGRNWQACGGGCHSGATSTNAVLRPRHLPFQPEAGGLFRQTASAGNPTSIGEPLFRLGVVGMVLAELTHRGHLPPGECSRSVLQS